MDGSGQRHRMPFLGFLCLVLLVIGNVQSTAICRTGCSGGAAQTFKYAIGTTYKYSYEGEIEISLTSAEQQSTKTGIKATVLLTQLPECNQLIRLQNVQISGSDGKKFGSIPDIEKPIRINNNDGVIDDSICVVDGDNQNSINVKRAIASIFQAATKGNYETDVFGRCPTTFSTQKHGNVVIIGKSKSLNRCAFREHVLQDFFSTAINLNSEIKSSPLLNGDYNANLKIKNGILDQGTINEEYLFVPFSVGKNGAKAQITSKLQLTGNSQETPQAPVTQPRSIIFEYPHPVNSPASNVATILGAVKEVAKTIDLVVSERTAKEFLNLLKIVKVSKKADLLAVYNQVKSGVGVGDKDAARRLYLDALLRAGNGDSVEAILELMDKKQLDDLDAKLALLSLNVVKHANAGALKAAANLLDLPQLPREAYLGIGNLAGRFCEQHPCDDVPEVKTLTNKLLSKIVAKPANREQENDAVFALKALRNLRNVIDTAVPKITGIAQNKNLPNRVRVAALEAFLADPCTDKLRTSALQILQDIQQDSEVRIKAYLVLAECPNAKIGNAIKTLLTKEPSVQVGGFITTHIHALRASTNPDKALAKQFLGFSVRPNFPIDPRKFSFNAEFSYAIDTLGLGSSTEANIIYSQNSWLPRSASLNLTADIFGHSFNFLEIETRQENLDRLIEHYFGPKGVLKQTVLRDAVKESRSKYEEISNYVNDKIHKTLHRNRRDVTKAEIDQIAKQVQIKTSELNKDLDVDLSLKLFGSEIAFLNVNQEAKLKPETIIDEIMKKFTEGFDKLMAFDETLRRNFNILIAELDYPTSLGFPLRLAAEGTANVQLKAQGNVDLRQLINNRDKGELKIKLIPSVVVEIAGQLTLDALVVENGLKIATSLYTATGGDLKATWDKSTGFDVKFGLPLQEQKIISANHELVFTTREQSVREVNVPLKFTQVKDFSICVDHLNPFIGLTFCVDMNGPNVGGKQVPILPFPLAGDAKFTVTVENTDVLEYSVHHGIQKSHADLTLEWIDKENKKRVVLDIQGEYSPEHYVKALFNSNEKTALAEARILSTNVEKALLLKAAHNKDEYLLKLGVTISGTPERAVYKPILQFKTPMGNHPLPVTTDGQLIVEKNGNNIKLIFENIKISSENKFDLGLTGNAGRGDTGIYFADVSINNGPKKVDLEGRLQLTGELIKFNIKQENNLQRNLNFNLKGEFKNQQQQQQRHYDVALQLIHGADLNSKTNIITLNSNYVSKYKDSNDFKLSTKNSFSYPLHSVTTKFEFEATPKSLDYEVNAEYGELKIGSELEAKVNDKTAGDFDLEFEIWGLDNKFELKTKRQVLANDESKISNVIELNGKKFEVEGKVKHVVHPQNLDIGTELTAHIPSQAAPIQISTGLVVNPVEIDVHAKINSGSDVIVDAFLKANRKGNANGSVKYNGKTLNLNGQLHSNNGVGTSDLLVTLKNGDRQIKLDSTFNVQPGKVLDASVTIFPSFNKDKNNKIYLKTENQLTETSIDSKNKADILGHPLEANLKFSQDGDHRTGKLDGEFELTLPGDKYFVVKGNCDHKKESDGLTNGISQASLEYRKNKNSSGEKIIYKSTWKNTNLKSSLADVEISISADDSNGKNINADFVLKTSKENDQHNLNSGLKLTGSILQKPFELNAVSDCKKGLSGQVEITSKYGNENSATARTTYDISGATKQGNLKIQIATSSDNLKTFVVDTAASVTPNKDNFQLDGTVNVQGVKSTGSFVDLKSSASVKGGIQSGEAKVNVALNEIDPVAVNAAYTVKANRQGGSVNGAVTYGKGQTVKSEIAVERTPDHKYKLVAELQTPLEGHKNTQLVVEGSRSADGRQISSSGSLTLDGETWKHENELILSEVSPLVHLKTIRPDGKLCEILFNANRLGLKQFSSELKLVNEEKSFNLNSGINVDMENIDDFVIKGNVDSPKLNIDKITFEITNQGTSQDKKIQVSVKSANKNYISGSLNYAAKNENGKFIIDGTGSLKIKDESKSGNFKYMFERLEQDKNKEHGVQISIDGSVGHKAVDVDFKLTNKHFRTQTSYCEETKECANIEIDNKITASALDAYSHVLEINVDLRKLGVPNEVGLKAVTDRKGWIIDHTVDAHLRNQDNSKYQYSVSLHPTQAAATLTTPKRIISLEAKTVPIANIKQGGRANGEIVFYMDKKNHPAKKTSLSWVFDLDLKGKVFTETKLNHPGLRKPLVASIQATREGNLFNGNLKVVSIVDTFAEDNQKLTLNYYKKVAYDINNLKGTSELLYSVKSAGLGINIEGSEIHLVHKIDHDYKHSLNVQIGKVNYDNGITFRLSPNELSGTVKIFNKDLIKAVNRIQAQDNQQLIETEISSVDNNPLISKLEIKNYNTLSLDVSFKNEPNKKLVLNAGVVPGQVVDIRAEKQIDGAKINLFYATLQLDEANFLKSDYKVDHEAIKVSGTHMKERAVKYWNDLETAGKEFYEETKKELKEYKDIAKKASPNLQPLKQFYSKELQELKEEILTDQNIIEFNKAAQKVFGSLIAAATQLFEKISSIAEEASKAIQKSFATIISTIEEKTIPEIREYVQRLSAEAKVIAEKVMDMALLLVGKIAEISEKYKPQIKDLVAPFAELFQDIGKLLYRIYQNSYDNTKALISRVSDQIRNSNYLQQLKTQYEQFIKQNVPSRDGIINTIKETVSNLKDMIPPEIPIRDEIIKVLENLVNYIEKKIKAQNVDDLVALEEIGRSILLIFKKIMDIVGSENLQLPSTKVDFPSMLPISFFQSLPHLVAAKFSPLYYLYDGERMIERIVTDLALNIVDKPTNLIPPIRLFAMVTQGAVFTFDGKFIPFPGKCNYLLARDAVNGNFTIAGTYKDGILTSITLSDEEATLTLVQGGKVKANQQNVELPYRKTSIAAFRDYESVTLTSASGVTVSCGIETFGCGISVSGFYHGQLRGLLGNGNWELYDDLTIPGGKIVNSDAKLGNAYKLSSSCADIAVPSTENVQQNAACNKLFSAESLSLQLCYPFVSVDNFKTACSLGLAAGVKDTEESIAKAYVAACQNRNILTHVPAELVKCTNSDKPFNVEDIFSVKLPSKSADIVIIVDTTKKNQQLYEKLSKVLLPEISTELHAKGVRDIEFHVITYGGVNQWPSHVTVNGKLTFKGKPPVLKFDNDPESYDEEAIETPKMKEIAKQIHEIIENIQLGTGANLKTKTYDAAYKYPFRANSLKSIIVINGDACKVSHLGWLQKAYAHLFKNNLYSVNLFTPVPTLTAKDSKKIKDVIGWNTENAFSLSQAKKNPKGTPELFKDISYDDFCIDFTNNNRGNTFVNDNFLSLSEADQKTFAKVAATNIAEKLVNIEQGLDCECKMVNPYNAKNVCKEAFSKERNTKKV